MRLLPLNGEEVGARNGKRIEEKLAMVPGLVWLVSTGNPAQRAAETCLERRGSPGGALTGARGHCCWQGTAGGLLIGSGRV